ncbi:hypothetical protein KUCAC02_027244 [Chaenocephalus aceratus]|uniref:Uncharacterized protein n=1 Tax=Chaenocephalus aceratus TaxID=36190 RepID=A0ACB9W4M0_CHAAC|nr:hypothetical protein KUCAC02_027244 [Chaenocephalus aceratus]
MEGRRMWREEVSILQADCWMERLRDGQMTMAGGPECRLRETQSPLRVGSGRYANREDSSAAILLSPTTPTVSRGLSRTELAFYQSVQSLPVSSRDAS